MTRSTQAERALELALDAARRPGTAEDVMRLRSQLDARLATGVSAGQDAGAASAAAVGGGAKLVVLAGVLAGLALAYIAWHSRAAQLMPVAKHAPSAINQPISAIHAAPPPTAAPSMPTQTPTATPMPPAAPTAPARKTLRMASTPPPLLQAPAAVDGRAEIALVTQAQALVETQPMAALTILAEHEQRFPHGVLAEERDVLRFDAERAAGQNDVAATHARAFIVAYPASTQTRRLEHWLALRSEDASLHNKAP